MIDEKSSSDISKKPKVGDTFYDYQGRKGKVAGITTYKVVCIVESVRRFYTYSEIFFDVSKNAWAAISDMDDGLI